MATFGILLLSYFLGSIPFGLLVARLGGVDIRRYGSGRTGTANVLRTLGARAAVPVFMGDMLKGMGAILLAGLLLDSPAAWAGAGLMAMAGHNWPAYLGFRGGRGVATGFGALIALSWPVALVALGVAISALLLTRYVSLASLLGAGANALAMATWALAGWEPASYLLYSLAGSALILFQHRDNLGRLLAGTERRLGQPAEARSK